jgi:hypothetical protein
MIREAEKRKTGKEKYPTRKSKEDEAKAAADLNTPDAPA